MPTGILPSGAASIAGECLHREARILLIDIFAGIRGGRYALRDLPVCVIAEASSEIDEFALQVQRGQEIGGKLWGDITELVEETVASFVSAASGDCDFILIIAQMTCEDASRLKYSRMNLACPEGGEFKYFLQVGSMQQKRK